MKAKSKGGNRMYCGNCGEELQEGVKFCPRCGKQNEVPGGISPASLGLGKSKQFLAVISRHHRS
jgi:predicted amidophosphoribosyltransferase